MSGDDSRQPRSPTRRECVRYWSALAAGGLLAGCTGDQDGDAPATTTTAERAEGTEAATATATETPAGAGEEYTVSMSPTGPVTFEAVPETVFGRLTHHAGMALAVGRGDALTALHAPEFYDVVWNKFLARLDGVSVDWAGLHSATEFTREDLYEYDSDLHLVDPASVVAMDNWDGADVEEVTEAIAPWFGNKFSADRATPPAAYDDYQYYGLWEIFEKVARVFRERDRYEQLASVHDELLTTIQDGLPPESARPRVALVLFSPSDEDMWGYPLNSPGFYAAHTRPLGATGAFDDAGLAVGDDATIDAEALASADPDVILALASMSEDKNLAEIREFLRSHPVLSSVTAVQDDRVHPQGARWQGPLLNLFQLEMTAKQLYPDQFGSWPTYVDGQYPDIPPAEQLFDRDRVAGIVTGDDEA